MVIHRRKSLYIGVNETQLTHVPPFIGSLNDISPNSHTATPVKSGLQPYESTFVPAECGPMWYRLTSRCYIRSNNSTIDTRDLFVGAWPKYRSLVPELDPSVKMEEEVAAIRKHLEELENVLQTDNTTIEMLEKKWRQSEAEKKNLLNVLEKTKLQLDEERSRRRNQEEKVEELTKALRKEYETIVMIRDVLLNG